MRQAISLALICAAALTFPCDSAHSEESDEADLWRYRAEPGRPSADWRELSFDDSAWELGEAGFGYGDGDDTTVLDDMEGNYVDVYLRKIFEISEIPEALFLYVDYDDAFAAYVNGQGVAFGGYTRDGIQSHEAGDVEVFQLNTAHLATGQNVLAIHGRNRSESSSDFSLHPTLLSKRVDVHSIAPESARKTLSALRARLLEQSSYLERTNRNPVAVLDAFSVSIEKHISRTDFVRGIQQIVALIGDGHAKVSTSYLNHGAVYLPFSLAEVDGGVVGVDVDGRKSFDSEYPFVRAIDGINIERWIDVASRYVSRASPQLNRRRALRTVQRIDLLRYDLGLPDADDVSVTLENKETSHTVVIQLSSDRPRTARVEIGVSRVLAGNIGYLPIPRMDDNQIPSIHRQLRAFRNTDGLIIDVRSNGGGRYGIARAMAPYFSPPGAKPFVANIAKYRLADSFDVDHLASRPTFRLNYEGWSDVEIDVIKSAMATFDPVWEPPFKKFSEWHFMLMNREGDRTECTYYYDKPVVVLSNAESFSATDGFLSVFSSFPNVTVMGQPSGGGSGRTRRFTLHTEGPRSSATEIEVALSSMASFRANGLLFDGYGVEVDQLMKPTLTDILGESDTVVTEAITTLVRRK